MKLAYPEMKDRFDHDGFRRGRERELAESTKERQNSTNASSSVKSRRTTSARPTAVWSIPRQSCHQPKGRRVKPPNASTVWRPRPTRPPSSANSRSTPRASRAAWNHGSSTNARKRSGCCGSRKTAKRRQSATGRMKSTAPSRSSSSRAVSPRLKPSVTLSSSATGGRRLSWTPRSLEAKDRLQVLLRPLPPHEQTEDRLKAVMA